MDNKTENQSQASADAKQFQEKKPDVKKPGKCPTCGRDTVNS